MKRFKHYFPQCLFIALFFCMPSSAGILQLDLKNVNFSDPAPDIDVLTGVTSVDSPDFIFATLLNPDPLDPHAPAIPEVKKVLSRGAALSKERVISIEHPLESHFEVNVTRIDADSQIAEFLPDRFLLRAQITGATFKNQLNGEDIIRPGRRDDGPIYADVLGQTGLLGETNVDMLVENHATHPQTDFGLILPVLITGGDNDIFTPCEPVMVQVQLFSATGFGGPQPLGTPDTLLLMSCEESFGFDSEPLPVKLDFEHDFKSFLDIEHQSSKTAILGNIEIAVWPNLFDPKSDTTSSERRVDFGNIDHHALTLQFEDLTGIAAVNLLFDESATSITGIVDRASNTASFVTDGTVLSNTAENIFIEHPHQNHGPPGDVLKESIARARIEITTFSDDVEKFKKEEITDAKGNRQIIKIPTGAGAIAHQTVQITHNQLILTDPCKERDGSTIRGITLANIKQAKHICEIDLPTGAIFDISRTGETFGPFDWINQANTHTVNFFRVSNIPQTDGHGDAIHSLDGLMTIKNASGNSTSIDANFDGDYKFSLDFDPTLRNQGANGVYVIGPMKIRNILLDHNIPANFGTADISFTFFLNSTINSEAESFEKQSAQRYLLDVDRLMVSNGKTIPYLDNSNDSASDYGVSGDEMRAGPKAPLKLHSLSGN